MVVRAWGGVAQFEIYIGDLWCRYEGGLFLRREVLSSEEASILKQDAVL